MTGVIRGSCCGISRSLSLLFVVMTCLCYFLLTFDCFKFLCCLKRIFPCTEGRMSPQIRIKVLYRCQHRFNLYWTFGKQKHFQGDHILATTFL